MQTRTAANPAFNRPGVPGLLPAINASQTSSNTVNAVLVRLRPGADPDEVAESVRRWKRLTVYTRAEICADRGRRFGTDVLGLISLTNREAVGLNTLAE